MKTLKTYTKRELFNNHMAEVGGVSNIESFFVGPCFREIEHEVYVYDPGGSKSCPKTYRWA